MNVMRLFGRQRPPTPENRAYEAIVAAARHPGLYESYGVPDTVEGRFDMIVLHLFLVLERLHEWPDFAQGLVDEMFSDMDRSMREMGAGDPAVPKKVRRMAEVYYGRVTAYRRAVAEGDDALEHALRRNVFAGGAGDAQKLARYVGDARHCLSRARPADLARGTVVFADPAP